MKKQLIMINIHIRKPNSRQLMNERCEQIKSRLRNVLCYNAHTCYKNLWGTDDMNDVS